MTYNERLIAVQRPDAGGIDVDGIASTSRPAALGCLKERTVPGRWIKDSAGLHSAGCDQGVSDRARSVVLVQGH